MEHPRLDIEGKKSSDKQKICIQLSFPLISLTGISF